MASFYERLGDTMKRLLRIILSLAAIVLIITKGYNLWNSETNTQTNNTLKQNQQPIEQGEQKTPLQILKETQMY